MDLTKMLPIDPAVREIEKFERFRAEPYIPVPGDHPTIGFGSTHYMDGTPVTMDDPPISSGDAYILLAWYANESARTLWRAFTRQPTPNQWAAMLSLAYNIGAPAIATSTLVRKFNAGDDAGADAEFPKWDHVHRDGQLVAVPGLLDRRHAEAALYENVQSVQLEVPLTEQQE